tara:strand:+ start:1399 stop:1977 length:579 start_codon:yes stop_codon:yes gene_type:complete
MYLYKITSTKDKNLFYIGSTDNFEERKKQHIYNLYNEKASQFLYRKIKDVGGGFDFKIMKAFECDKSTLLIEEERMIRDLKPTLNVLWNIDNSLKYEFDRETDFDKQLRLKKEHVLQDPKEWERKINIFLDDLKINPPKEMGIIFVNRKYEHLCKSGKIKTITKKILICKNEFMITDRPYFELKKQNGDIIV